MLMNLLELIIDVGIGHLGVLYTNELRTLITDTMTERVLNKRDRDRV